MNQRFTTDQSLKKNSMKNLAQNLRDFATKLTLPVKQSSLWAFVFLGLFTFTAFTGHAYLQGDNFFQRMLSRMKAEVAEIMVDAAAISEQQAAQLKALQLSCAGTVGGMLDGDDFDGDGVCNDIDIDDDNDGILDTEESPTCLLSQTDLESGDRVNYITVSSDILSNGIDYAYNNVVDGLTTANSDRFQFKNPESIAGQTLFQFAFPAPIEMTELLIDLPSAIVFVTGSTSVLQGSMDGNTWTDLSASIIPAALETDLLIDYPVTQNQGAYQYYRIEGIAGMTTIGTINEIRFSFTNFDALASCSEDTDGDNIPNHFDLDSDGDGCSDAFEGGATTDDTADFQFPTGNVGSNGLDNSLEGSPEDGVVNYASTYGYYAQYADVKSCSDTDNDGVEDISDLDDDNDGILDAEECPRAESFGNRWHL